MEPSSQVQPVQDQTATATVASLLLDDETKEQIISEVKSCFWCVVFLPTCHFLLNLWQTTFVKTQCVMRWTPF